MALETHDERRRRLDDNERYNRRTRAIERHAAAQKAQADALCEIAEALKVQALATAIGTSATTTSSEPRVWTVAFASAQMNRLAKWAEGLRR